MKLERYVQYFRNTLVSLFPNVRAYINFMLLWLFLLVMISHAKTEPVIVLVSSIGTIYCFNEWVKAMKGR